MLRESSNQCSVVSIQFDISKCEAISSSHASILPPFRLRLTVGVISIYTAESQTRLGTRSQAGL